jgi:hypothetical protein
MNFKIVYNNPNNLQFNINFRELNARNHAFYIQG